MTSSSTSAGPGKGAELGGLEGADAHCQMLATTVGAGGKTWHAYLSTNTNLAEPNKTVNARDRIGKGPWQNFKGDVIATSVDDLHNDANNKISATTGLTERGQRLPTFGYSPNYHDIMTGSQPDGKAFPGNMNLSCANYTSSTFGKQDRQSIEGPPPPRKRIPGSRMVARLHAGRPSLDRQQRRFYARGAVSLGAL